MKAILQWGIVLMGIVLGISLIRSMTKILGSNGRITQARSEVDALKRENNDLNETLKDVTGVQFIESQARDKLGLAEKGEIVVVLPDENKLRLMAPKIEEKQESLPLPIWKMWWKMFF